MARKSYPSDVSDEEWAFVAPYLTLMKEDAPQRQHELRQVFDALRWMVRSGSPWRYLPNDFPCWDVVYQQTQRWLKAGCFEAMVEDLRMVLRVFDKRKPTPSAAIYDSRTLSSTPESGARAGYNGHKKTKGSKVHVAVDTLGHLLALKVTPANVDDRTQVEALSQELQAATGQSVQIAFVDQGYTGDNAAEQADKHGIKLCVVKLEEARRGFVLLPRRWVVERSFAWATRFRRLAKDYERLPETVAGLHFLAFACLMLKQCFAFLAAN
jgi:transposase